MKMKQLKIFEIIKKIAYNKNFINHFKPKNSEYIQVLIIFSISKSKSFPKYKYFYWTCYNVTQATYF